MKNINQNATKTNMRIVKISNFKMKMKLKIKIFPCNLYPFNIDVHFKHENTLCTLLKIVYIIQIFKFGFSQAIKLFTNLYSFVWLKKRQWNYGFNC